MIFTHYYVCYVAVGRIKMCDSASVHAVWTHSPTLLRYEYMSVIVLNKRKSDSQSPAWLHQTSQTLKEANILFVFQVIQHFLSKRKRRTTEGNGMLELHFRQETLWQSSVVMSVGNRWLSAVYLLHSGVSSVENSYAQLQSGGHHGPHLAWWTGTQHTHRNNRTLVLHAPQWVQGPSQLLVESFKFKHA